MVSQTEAPYPPGSSDELLARIANLPPTQFETLRAAIQGPEAFSLTDGRVSKLAESFGISELYVRRILATLSNLYSFLHHRPDRTHEKGEDGDVFKSLREVIGSLEELPNRENDFKLVLQKLSVLLTKNSEVDKGLKRERLKQGFMPNAVAFSTLVDVRPLFNDARDEIDDLLSVVQLRIMTDARSARDQNIVVQLDQEAIHKLRAAVDILEKKYATLKEWIAVSRVAASKKQPGEQR